MIFVYWPAGWIRREMTYQGDNMMVRCAVVPCQKEGLEQCMRELRATAAGYLMMGTKNLALECAMDKLGKLEGKMDPETQGNEDNPVPPSLSAKSEQAESPSKAAAAVPALSPKRVTFTSIG